MRGVGAARTIHHICASEFDGELHNGLPDLNLRGNKEFIGKAQLWFDTTCLPMSNKIVFLVSAHRPRKWTGLRVFSIDAKGQFVSSEAVVASFLKPIMEIAKKHIEWVRLCTP